MVDAFKERKEMVYQLLSDVKGFILNNPTGAFYFFPDISFYFGKTIKGKTINNADESL